MDMVSKALVKNQVSSLTKSIGLSGEDEEKEERPHDYRREQEEDEKAARDKAKRDEVQLRKKAERAAERNKMREKYGLKESKTDQKLLESRDQLGKNAPPSSSSSSSSSSSASSSSASSSSKETGRGKGKDENSCAVM